MPLGFAVIGVVLACAQDREPGAPAELSRVRDVVNGLIAADNARDIERVVELYAPDAILMPPDESPVEGIAAIRPRYERRRKGD